MEERRQQQQQQTDFIKLTFCRICSAAEYTKTITINKLANQSNQKYFRPLGAVLEGPVSFIHLKMAAVYLLC